MDITYLGTHPILRDVINYNLYYNRLLRRYFQNRCTMRQIIYGVFAIFVFSLIACSSSDQPSNPKPAAENTPPPADTIPETPPIITPPALPPTGTLQDRLTDIEKAISELTGKLAGNGAYETKINGYQYDLIISGFSLCLPAGEPLDATQSIGAPSPGISIYGCTNKLSFSHDASDPTKITLVVSIPVHLLYVHGYTFKDTKINSFHIGYTQTNDAKFTYTIEANNLPDGGFSLINAQYPAILGKNNSSVQYKTNNATINNNTAIAVPEIAHTFVRDAILQTIQGKIATQNPFATL